MVNNLYYKVSQFSFIRLLNIFNNTIDGQINDRVIEMLQNWTLLLKERECLCPRGHQLFETNYVLEVQH